MNNGNPAATTLVTGAAVHHLDAVTGGAACGEPLARVCSDVLGEINCLYCLQAIIAAGPSHATLSPLCALALPINTLCGYRDCQRGDAQASNPFPCNSKAAHEWDEGWTLAVIDAVLMSTQQ